MIVWTQKICSPTENDCSQSITSPEKCSVSCSGLYADVKLTLKPDGLQYQSVNKLLKVYRDYKTSIASILKFSDNAPSYSYGKYNHQWFTKCKLILDTYSFQHFYLFILVYV